MSRMTSKGQVTIPKRIRDHLGLKAGSEVEFEYADGGKVVLKPSQDARHTQGFAALRGTLGPGMTGDELMMLTRGWGEADREGR